MINTGRRLWIISDEMSMNMETKPSVHTVRGIRGLLSPGLALIAGP
jgi:hypothetical protein